MKQLLCLLLCAAFLLAAPARAEITAAESDKLYVSWDNDGTVDGYTFRMYRDGGLLFEKSLSGRCRRYAIPRGYWAGPGQYHLELIPLRDSQPQDGSAYDFAVPSEAAPTATPDRAETPKPEAAPAPTEPSKPAMTPAPTVKATPSPTAAPTVKATPSPTAAPTESLPELARQVMALVNEERAAQGLNALAWDEELARAAGVRAGEIQALFSHTRPDGSPWHTASTRAFGENIAMGYPTPAQVMAAWMNSDGHRENILRPSFGSIGVCAVKVSGVYYWAQLFGQ